MCDCEVDKYTARRQAEADQDEILAMRGESYDAGRADGAREEREAVVRWLRDTADVLAQLPHRDDVQLIHLISGRLAAADLSGWRKEADRG